MRAAPNTFGAAPVLLRAAAIVLALATAITLVQIGRAAEPQPAAILLAARALTLGALLHLGLFLAPGAKRPWHRLAVAALMLPSALIVVGFTGEAISRALRGAPALLLSTAIGVLGVAAYAAAYWVVAQRPWRDA
ncbi:MAG: hypothetical protein AB1762_16675 [Gemmatimonadota bacterium]